MSGRDGRAWGATHPIRSLAPAIGLAAALEAFCAGKAAEGLSPRSIVWYRMIGERLVGRFGAARPVDALTLPELRTWLVELRATLSPMSVAGYLRGLRALGNWLARDGLAVARALRALANPRAAAGHRAAVRRRSAPPAGGRLRARRRGGRHPAR